VDTSRNVVTDDKGMGEIIIDQELRVSLYSRIVTNDNLFFKYC